MKLMIDLDGTMYHGTKIIESAYEFMKEAQRRNIDVLFLTNNATRTPIQAAEHMLKMGYENIQPEQFYTSAMASADEVKRLSDKRRAYMIGELGLKEALIQNGFELVDVEYVKEAGENYLRIYIDKEGGIFLTDCEALSRRMSDVLDEEDFISDSYYLEVSSPGLNRKLFTIEHYKKYINREIKVILKSAINGSKTHIGILKSVNEDAITIMQDEELTILMDKIKSANFSS